MTSPIPGGGPDRNADAGLRVIIFSSLAPFEPWRLMNRLVTEIPGVQLAGLVYEQRLPKTFPQRIRLWTKSMRQGGYPGYVMSRIASAATRLFRGAATVVLRSVQASSVSSRSVYDLSLHDLGNICQQRAWPFLLTDDIHGAESLSFVRQQRPDLGIVLGTRILKPSLYGIPRWGSINVHKRKVPDYRGGGPIGLWEMLDGQKEIGVTVHRVAEKVDTGTVIGATVIPIETYDNITSLTLKADLIGEELLLAAVRDIMSGTCSERPQVGTGKTFKSPKAHEMRQYEKKLKASRASWLPVYGRPVWKLLLRSSLYAWLLPMRNWRRRLGKRFPVVILYHHLITDRAHPMGLPTEAFLSHLRYLKRHYRLVSMAEAARMLASGKVEQPTVVLTFDDGYADNFVNLRAALRVEPTPVTLFVCPRLMETGEPFPHDTHAGLHDFSPLSVDQLRKLHAEGLEIGSHTRTHFDCGATDASRLKEEILGSREDLEAILGEEITLFSFPWGSPRNMSETAVSTAAKHYRWYCSAYGGENWHGPTEGHLKRKSYPLNLWELELTLQGVLEFSLSRQPLHPVARLHPEGGTSPEVNASGDVAGSL